MIFSEQAATTDWVTLSHDGQALAEAWRMPEGGAFTVVFLVPRERLEVADPGRRVTIDTLLTAADISMDQVAAWRLGADADNPDPSRPLPPPAADDSHLTVYVQLKPPPRTAAEPDGDDTDIPLEKWQALDTIWRGMLGLEASIDASRLGMESLRGEMDAAFKKPLAVEEKLHALQADVAQWTKAKSRVHHALPKVREFIHRATWAQAIPERKRLEEIVENHVVPRVPLSGVDRVREQLEHLQKDRQVLLAQGNAVYQECRGTLSEIQRALNTLQRNAADRARNKRSTGRDKGKFF